MKPLYVTELKSFPHPELTLAGGILDVSDDLRVERLLEAYSHGIFPWPHEDLPTLWFSPEERGILDFKDFKVPRSLTKFLKKVQWTATLDQDFDRVIEACARQTRPGQHGTWINRKIIKAYQDFHKAGYAHSLEVWDGERLIGGLYGVYVGGLFCGESMFHLEPNASKFAVLKLVEFLKSEGFEWMDIQMVTPVLEQFGGRYVRRRDFLRRLESARNKARPVQFKI